MDFQFDASAECRRLKFLSVIDEYSRLCLAIRVGRRCKTKDVEAVLEELTSLYPASAFIWLDNPRSSCPGSAELVLSQPYYQDGLHRAGIPMGERLCRVVALPLPG